MRSILSSLALLVSVIASCNTQAAGNLETRVAEDFFGMHLRWGASTTPWPVVPFDTWRLISPETEWRGVEPKRDAWNFKYIDAAVAKASAHGAKILLTLGQTPGWASSRPNEASANGPGYSAEPTRLDDWQKYVEAVVERYKGRISYYEIWNEPYYDDIAGRTTKGHFSGSVASMINMAKAASGVIRRVDPAAKIVSPSCTSPRTIGFVCVELFLANGGAKYVDILGFHYYANPEEYPEISLKLQGLQNKYGVSLPIWNTEYGFLTDLQYARPRPELGPPFDKVASRSATAAKAARAMLFNITYGVQKAFYYSWDIPDMGIADRRGADQDVDGVRAYAQAKSWFLDSVFLGRPVAYGTSIYFQKARSRAGRERLFVWNYSEMPADFARDELDGMKSVQTLQGAVEKIGSNVTIDPGTMYMFY